jgi:outer membrane protein TolC
MVAAAIVLHTAPSPAQQPLTLAEAVARALEHNPDLAVDEPGQAAARSELRAGQAGYLPRLDFELGYNGGNNPVYVFGTLLTQQRFTEANFAIPALNSPAPVQNVQTRFTAQQTVWDFGRTSDRIQQARIGVELSDRRYEEHKLRVILGVIEAYYGVSLSRENQEASRLAVESAESIVKQAQARFESGFTVEADLLRAQASLAAARQREIQAGGQLDSARAALNRIMGDALDAATGDTAGLSPTSLPLPSEEEMLAGQRQRRTDYQALLAEVRQAESQMRARKAEFYPVLAGFASWETDNPSWIDAGGNNWLAGISLRWNIFAGRSDSAQLEAARYRLEQKRRQVAAMESGMRLELRNALVQTRSAEQQVDVTLAAERQSEESLKILRNRYDAGLATMTDLLTAEAARAQARTALAEAIYRHRLSYAQLEFAAGLLSPTSTAMKP